MEKEKKKSHFCLGVFITGTQTVTDFFFKVNRYASSVGLFTVVENFIVWWITRKSVTGELI